MYDSPDQRISAIAEQIADLEDRADRSAANSDLVVANVAQFSKSVQTLGQAVRMLHNKVGELQKRLDTLEKGE